MLRFVYLILAFSIFTPNTFASSHYGNCTRAELRNGCRNVRVSECRTWIDRCVGDYYCTPECVAWMDVDYCECRGWSLEQNGLLGLLSTAKSDRHCSSREEFGTCVDGTICCKKLPYCADGSACF